MNRTDVKAYHPNKRPNFTVIDLGDLRLWFSYYTCIAFMAPGEGVVISENVWGPTTGKHLNSIAHSERLPRVEFEQRLHDMVSRLTLEERPTLENIRAEFLEVAVT